MSWLTEYVRPKVRSLLQRDVPENLWTNCESCAQMLQTRDYERNRKVCPHCGHHGRALAHERLEWTFDEGQYTTIDLPKMPIDPLVFRDSKRYGDRLKAARAKSKLDDTLLVAHGNIAGRNTVVAVMAFEFMAGTMGAAMGEAFLAACRLAVLQKSPLVVFTASGGARMQEGLVSLMQMPRTTIGVQMLREAGLPYIVVFTNPTTGGVSASFAMLGDIHVAEPNALIAFAGPRVIRDTVREALPEGFQRSEYLMEHGMVDLIAKRAELPALLGRLVNMLGPAQRAVTLPGPEEALASLGGATESDPVSASAQDRDTETAEEGRKKGKAKKKTSQHSGKKS